MTTTTALKRRPANLVEDVLEQLELATHHLHRAANAALALATFAPEMTDARGHAKRFAAALDREALRLGSLRRRFHTTHPCAREGK